MYLQSIHVCCRGLILFLIYLQFDFVAVFSFLQSQQKQNTICLLSIGVLFPPLNRMYAIVIVSLVSEVLPTLGSTS